MDPPLAEEWAIAHSADVEGRTSVLPEGFVSERAIARWWRGSPVGVPMPEVEGNKTLRMVVESCGALAAPSSV
jgi:hypothetical protein